MAGTRVLDRDVWVSYAQVYVLDGVEGPPFPPDLRECFLGQSNGLCGAAAPGGLFLITGLHTGRVGFVVEVHAAAPRLDTGWEDVVEVSCRIRGNDLRLVQWAGSAAYGLAVAPGEYRVRYSASGMDAAHQGGPEEGDPPLDRYLLQWWPAPAGPDEVVRVGSEQAAYWHGVARALPPAPTPEQRAAAERAAQVARERESTAARQREEEQQRRMLAQAWGVRPPTSTLQAVCGNVRAVVDMEPELVARLDAAGDATQRRVARWVALAALAEAGLDTVDWFAPVVAALTAGGPLPATFHDETASWDRLFTDPAVPQTVVTTLDGRHDNCSQQAMAVPTVRAVEEPDPLIAACEALWHAAHTFGRGHTGRLFDDLRRAFPEL